VLDRLREGQEARQIFHELVPQVQVITQILQREWRVITEGRFRSLRSNGLDCLELDEPLALILRTKRVWFRKEGFDAPGFGFERDVYFYGHHGKRKGSVTREGQLCSSFPFSTQHLIIFFFAIIQAYKHLVMGGDRELDRESSRLEREARQACEEGKESKIASTQLVIAGYARKRVAGHKNSPDNYQSAFQEGGYSRVWMDGDNPDHEAKNWVPEFLWPRDGAVLPKRYPRQTFSARRLRELVEKAREGQ
jgi:hypothetical protein